MPEWLLFLLIGFLAFRVARRGSCCGWNWERRDRLEENADKQRSRVESSRQRALSAPAPPSVRAATGQTRQESPLQTLQRRFVDGGLSLEDYEHELDRLYKSEPLSRR